METILCDRIRRVFYPYARVSTAELAGFWFVIAKETAPVAPPGRTIIHLNSRVDPHRSRFSTAVDRALSLLALGDWSTHDSALSDGARREPTEPNTSEWPLPQLVPFVISVSDRLLDWPRRPPDTATLNRIDETDPQTGDVCDQPNFQDRWNTPKAVAFERLLASACQTLARGSGRTPSGRSSK